MDLEQKTVVSFFETTIRLLGGLLSAFELSQEEVFLQKAQQLTDKLMISCEENFSKLPDFTFFLSWNSSQAKSLSNNAVYLSSSGPME